MAWFGLSLHPVEAGVPALRHRRKTASGCFDGIPYSPLQVDTMLGLNWDNGKENGNYRDNGDYIG